MIRRKTACLISLFVLLTIVQVGCVGPWAGHDRALTARLDEVLGRLSDSGAVYTARVLDPESGRELYVHDADAPFTPASNMKIPVSAAGLDLFGADHAFKTYLALDGDDLWVIGTGDPGIGDPRLAKSRGLNPLGVFDEWAGALTQCGVEHIEGNIYYYDATLDYEWFHSSWDYDDLLHWYAAPTSGLNFNDNCIDVTVYPTEVGQPVRYELMPPASSIVIINECLTAEEHQPEIVKLAGCDVYRLSGVCNRKTELISKPVENPGEFFCDALQTHLASRGIAINGEIKKAPWWRDSKTQLAECKLVAVHETSARDVIRRISTNSQNFFAEALCKLAGREYAARQGRAAPGSWALGEEAIRAFLRHNEIDDGGFVLADGSGLSHDNRVTARLISDIFAVMYDHRDGEAFIESLSQGGIAGTLRNRFKGFEGRVFAKTGYISGVRSLSGYVVTDLGRRLAFSIIYNQIPGDVKPFEELQDEAVRLLMRWPDLE